MKTSAWITIIWLYYAAVFMLCPSVSCQWPFQEDDLLFFGLIPLGAALIGFCAYRDKAQRTLSWIVFGLAVVGICLSFLPLRRAVGL
jgi:RsiW-degrading membrane proteinase PrsW (M82 family)